MRQHFNTHTHKSRVSLVMSQDIVDKLTFTHVNDFAFAVDLNAFVVRHTLAQEHLDGMDGVTILENGNFETLISNDILLGTQVPKLITGAFVKQHIIDMLTQEINEVIQDLNTLDQKVDTHLEDFENPHNVTKAHVGLSKVENKTSQDIRDEIVVNDIPELPQSKVENLESDLLDLNTNKIEVDVDNLTNYYDKNTVDNMVSQIPKFKIEVVETLPVEDISDTTIYVIDNQEWIHTEKGWEKLGSFDVNITNYYTKLETNNLLDNLIVITEEEEW